MIVSQVIINSVFDSSSYILLAVGFSIIYSAVRFFHLAHGSVYIISAYSSYFLIDFFKMDIILAVVIGIGVATASGIIIEVVVYKPLGKRNASNLVYLLSSFGVLIFIESLIGVLAGKEPLFIRSGPVETFNVLSASVTLIQVITIFVAAVGSTSILLFLKLTRAGKALRAVASDKVGASLVGINVQQNITLSFAIGSVLAAISGTLIGIESYLQPTMGFSPLLISITATITGGVGTVIGAVIGGLMLGFSKNIVGWFFPGQWEDAIAFIILVAFLTLRPRGFLGIKEQKEEI